MKKSYLQIATTTTQYTREVIFDSKDTSLWYSFDDEASKMGLKWNDLDVSRQSAILSSFKSSLMDLDEDFSEDPNLDRGWERWCDEVEVIG